MFTRFSSSSSRCLTLILVLFLVAGCFRDPNPPDDLYVRVVEGNVFDTTPIRGEFVPLRSHRTGFEYRCTECHSDFSSPTRQSDMQGEHSAIYDNFNHGMNTNCMNCHHQTERNSYVNRDGDPIDPSQPALLCAQCHGPTFRDWEIGIHGRQDGYWESSMGERKKLLCIQCHDPHSPKIKAMEPDPPPIYTRFEKHRPEIPGHAVKDDHKEEES